MHARVRAVLLRTIHQSSYDDCSPVRNLQPPMNGSAHFGAPVVLPRRLASGRVHLKKQGGAGCKHGR